MSCTRPPRWATVQCAEASVTPLGSRTVISSQASRRAVLPASGVPTGVPAPLGDHPPPPVLLASPNWALALRLPLRVAGVSRRGKRSIGDDRFTPWLEHAAVVSWWSTEDADDREGVPVASPMITWGAPASCLKGRRTDESGARSQQSP